MIEPILWAAFQKVYHALSNPMRKPINWAVTGSLGMVLHGMQMEIHDIDIQTDKDGAYEIERRLVNHLSTMVYFKASERMRSYFGKFEINGIKVEVMGGLQHLSLEQNWLPPVQVEQYKEWVDVEEMHIPVMTLEHEVEAYQFYRRNEKAELIKKFLLTK